MKWFQVFVFVLISLILSCKTSSTVHPNPEEQKKDCISEKVELFSKQECTKGASVKEYQFQGKAVFVFDRGQCGADMASDVFDVTCQKLGFLGGFMGNTSINGEDFSKAMFVRLVWQK